MTERKWSTNKPPNEVWVEVKGEDGEVLEANPFYGRDGMRPHWIGRDGRLWPVGAFRFWRPIETSQEPT
jgi:hypothetical protein